MCFALIRKELGARDSIVAVAVEELVEEQLAEMIVSKIDCNKDATETLGCVTLDIGRGVVHEWWKTRVPFVEFARQFHNNVFEDDADCLSSDSALVNFVDFHENSVQFDHL